MKVNGIEPFWWYEFHPQSTRKNSDFFFINHIVPHAFYEWNAWNKFTYTFNFSLLRLPFTSFFIFMFPLFCPLFFFFFNLVLTSVFTASAYVAYGVCRVHVYTYKYIYPVSHNQLVWSCETFTSAEWGLFYYTHFLFPWLIFDWYISHAHRAHHHQQQ